MSITRPLDQYSEDWPAYWAENPGLLRGVGAEAAVADPEPDSEPDPDPDPTPEPDPKPSKEELNAAIADEDWRTGLPDELKETAERFASKEDALRAIQDFRKRDSQVRVPGKGATDEQTAAYQKAIGVPDKPEAYEFPDQPEGIELTDEIKASQAEWSKRFHELNVPAATAKALSQMVNDDAIKQMTAVVEADKAFAKAQEEALRSEWKGDDYDKNKTLANRAFNDLANRAGLSVEDLTKIETKDGRFLMDRSEMVRIMATIGREMAEGTLGPALSESERDTVDDQIRDLRKEQEKAEADGDNKRKGQLYQKELALIEKRDGNKPIVGSEGAVI